MPPLPAIVLACPATVTLLMRALAGELPRDGYFDAWEKLDDPDAYAPSEEVRVWMQENWRALMPAEATSGDGVLPKVGQAVSQVIPTTPTLTHAREVWEDWMPVFFTAFVTTGGNITKAAQAAGKHRDTFYEHRDNNRLFYAAYLIAKEESDDRLRAALDDRAVVGWEEPVYGRVEKDKDGIVGHQWKYDSAALRLLATVRLPEFRAAKEAAGTNISINNSASAHASVGVTIPPELVASLQERKKRQLEKQAEREQRDASRHGNASGEG